MTVTELARSLSDFVNRATYRKEELLITHGGKPVAALSPAPTGVRTRALAVTFTNLSRLPGGDIKCLKNDLPLAPS